MSISVALTTAAAAGSFAFTSNVAVDDTVTIGGVVYTFKADPTGVANAVDVGSDLDDSIGNLVAAINLSGTDDDEYGAGTVINPYVSAVADLANDEIDLTSKIPGLQGNGIALAATSPGANDISAGAAALGLVSGATAGVGELFGTAGWFEQLLAENQINGEVVQHIRVEMTVAAD
jgi:hypothetical protein